MEAQGKHRVKIRLSKKWF